MYHLFGQKKSIENAIVLSYKFAPKEGLRDSISLKLAYKQFLHSIQPKIPVSFSNSDLEFISDTDLERKLIGFYEEDSVLDDKEQFNVISDQYKEEDRAERIDAIKVVIEELKKEYTEFAELLSLVINYIFCAKSNLAGGGSTSNAIGIIWANTRLSWHKNDIIEFFVHELTHNLLFLDELRYIHYLDFDLIQKPENYARSAILCVQRPLDKVVHSLVVATEVLLARENFLGHPEKPRLHPPTDIMLQACVATIGSLNNLSNKDQMVTERTLETIALCEKAIHKLQSSYLRPSLFLAS